MFSSHSGLACLCPRGVDVRYLHIADGSLDMLHLYLPSNLFGLLDIEDDGVRDVGLNYLAGIRDPLIAQIGQTIAQELVSGPATRASSLRAESLGVALAAHLVERYAAQGVARTAMAKSFDQVRGGLDSRRLKRVVEFVHAHVDANISLDAMAREACLSRFHFVRAFRQSTGQTPLAYVTAARIARAQELLRQTSSTIEDIALALNFSSSSNFVRTFKREVGLTPSGYRTRAS
jgi:AraC family transcriptional regulator